MAHVNETNPATEPETPADPPVGNLTVFLSYGFRPFFLLAPLYAVVAMGLFVFWMGIHHAGGQVITLSISQAPYIWHAHEMLFGYTLGVIAGFFLTAVPSWTGSRAVSGPVLGALVLCWLTGRFAMGFSASLPPLVVALFDLALLPALLPLVLAAMLGNWSKRNFVFLPIIVILFAANLMTHLEFMGLMDDGVARGHLMALDAFILLITIIGGRVVPAFTTNALRKRGIEDLPRNFGPANVAGITLVALLLVMDQVAPEHAATGLVALAAAAANAIRLFGWKALKTLDEPIVWVLHLGFLWLVVGLALKGLAVLDAGIGQQTALHALTAGAVGTMTIAVMSRAALGHTGRSLAAPRVITVAYGLVSVAAILRVAVPVLAPALYGEGILLSGVLWATAFAIFVVVYYPVLTRPHATRGTRGL